MTRVFCTRKKMPVILLLLLIVPFCAYADCQVTLQWDANDPAPEGYRVFGREEGQSYDYTEFSWQGDFSFQQCEITGLDENKTYYFVVRAYDGDNMSDSSNEVRFNSNGSTDNSDGSLHVDGGSGSGTDGLSTSCFIESVFQW